MKTRTKYILIALIIFCIAAIILFFFTTFSKEDTHNQFVIMSTTDIHGKIWDKNLNTDRDESNSMLAESNAVNQIRDNYGDKTVLFDNGDLYQGTILSTIDISHKNTDYDTYINPTSLCLSHLKYDGYTLGNHEFNFSVNNMDKIHSYLSDKTNLVCCNVYYPGNNQRVFKPYMIKTINVDNQDIKIGIIGLTNTDVPRWDNAGNYDNWKFHSEENPNGDIGYEIRKAQDDMEKNGDHCDFTIVSYHGGFFAEGSTSSSDMENFADKLEAKMQDPVQLYKNSESQGYRAVRQSHNIDMFILGHDHTDIYSNQQYKNADGKDTLVVNGAKKDLTKSVFELIKDPNTNKFEIKLKDSTNIHLSDYSSDSALKSKIQPYADSLLRLYSNKACDISDNWKFDNTDAEFYTQQTDISDLINRAQTWFVKKKLQENFKDNRAINKNIKEWFGNDVDLAYDENEPIDVDLSITTINLSSRPANDSIFTYKDITSLYPFENTIDCVPTKGQNIKDLLEYNASQRYTIKTDDKGNKHIETINDKYTCPVLWGLNFTYDMTRPEGDRVIIDKFTNGKTFDPNKTYCIALNNYLRGNSSNPLLEKIGFGHNSLDTKLDIQSILARTVLLEYCAEKGNNGQVLYPTCDVEKNGEVASHWTIKY